MKFVLKKVLSLQIENRNALPCVIIMITGLLGDRVADLDPSKFFY